ncbi:MAG: CoA transferase, partial [Sphingomonadales bacterium]|nr:CoA transferase [Sphingomonadales bacterium]
MPHPRRPLAGLGIVDLVTGPLAPATRYLADLGATVTHVATTTYDPSTPDGLKLIAAHAGKEQVLVDPTDPDSLAPVLDRIGRADAIVTDRRSGAG